jgi:hypothetical protein
MHAHRAFIIYVLAGGRYRNYPAHGEITEGTFQTATLCIAAL